MKRLSSFLKVLILALMVFSCASEQELEQSKLREPALGELGLSNNTNAETSRRRIIYVDASVEIARRRHSPDPTQCGDCKCGLGVCGVCFFCSTLPAPTPPDNSRIKANLYLEDNQYYFEIALDKPRVAGIDYTFYVDENIPVSDDSSYVVVKANYPVDPTIGLYGGYRIIVTH